MSQIEPLMKASDIASILGVSARQVSERYAMLPDFPRAVRLPSEKGQGHCRWRRTDILKWLNSL